VHPALERNGYNRLADTPSLRLIRISSPVENNAALLARPSFVEGQTVPSQAPHASRNQQAFSCRRLDARGVKVSVGAFVLAVRSTLTRGRQSADNASPCIQVFQIGHRQFLGITNR